MAPGPATDGGDQIQRWLDWSFGAFSSLSLAALALLMFCDVIGRYFLNAPIRGSFEIVQVLVAAIIFGALPVVTHRNLHVTVDLLDDVTPAWLAIIRNSLVQLLSAVVLSGVAWRLAAIAERRWDRADVTSFLRIPLYLVSYGMSILTAAAALAALVLFFRELTGAGRRWASAKEHKR